MMARYRHWLNEALAMHIEDFKDLVIIREELVSEGEPLARQSNELAVGTILRMFRALLGDRWQPDSVHFIHSAPPDLSVHRRLFGPNLQFDSDFNGIVCAAADLDRPNPAADPVMAAYAQQFLETLPKSEPGTTTLDTRKAIYLLLPSGKASIEQVAQEFGTSPAHAAASARSGERFFFGSAQRRTPRPRDPLSNRTSSIPCCKSPRFWGIRN